MLPLLRRKLGRALSHPSFVAMVLVAWFVLTRAVVLAGAYMGAAAMPPEKRQEWTWRDGATDLQTGPGPSNAIAPLVRWDAHFYIFLSRHGYPPPNNEGRPIYALAFFPLYPLVVHALDFWLHETFVAALVVSNVCTAIAAYLVHLLGKSGGRPSDGLRAAMLWLASPGAHFMSLPYTEGLFSLLIAVGLLKLSLRPDHVDLGVDELCIDFRNFAP